MRAVISEVRRNAMTSKQTHSDTSGSRRMAWMDWFGLIALGLLMVCSLVLLGQRNKTRAGKLAGGSYHVNADGSDITGVSFPVKVLTPWALKNA